MFDSTWPLWVHLTLFVLAAGAIGLAGTKLAGLADRLADRTGLGEAVAGTMFLGFITALPGVAASITAAVSGHPTLAISNALGGIALQTTFLAVADLVYLKANLEHAAASIANVMQTAILILLMTLVLVTLSGPNLLIAHIHPATLLLLGAAVGGFHLVYRASTAPMWHPKQTAETVDDIPEPAAQRESLSWLFFGFLVAAFVVLISGAAVAHTAGRIAQETGISESLMGGFFMAIATSLPELVTTVAAVRRGALTLAVSDIVGGNFFDVLFVCLADLAYLEGSLYHAAGVSHREVFLTGLAILLNTVLLIGLLYRQQQGPANIGFESMLLLVLYVAGFFILALRM